MSRTRPPKGPSRRGTRGGSSGPDGGPAAENFEGGPPPPDGDEAVTRVELARRLGLSTRTVGDHAAKGHLVKQGDRYLAWASARSLIAYQAKALAGRAGDGQEARARLAMAKAKIAELELAEREGRMADVVEMGHAVTGMIVRVRNRILYVPKRLPMALPHLTREDLAVIDRELRDALTELGEGRATPTEETNDGV